MTTITKRGDGRWVATITENGKRQHVYGYSRQEVKDKLATIEQNTNDSTGLTVESFLVEWLQKMRSSWKEKTYTSYEGELRLHIMPHIGHQLVANLTPDDIHALIERLQQDGRSSRSVYYSLIVLSRALNWAVKWGYVKVNVVSLVKLPRFEYKEFEPLTTEQARKLLAAVSGHRLETLYRLALSLGLRQGELIALRWTNLDSDRRVLTIQKSKTRAGRRALELPPPLYQSLLEHQERLIEEGLYEREGLMFPSLRGTPLSPRRLHRNFKLQLKKAGLPDSVRFHDMRHSCAAFLIAQGVNLHVVKEVLGHSTISVTSDTYGHLLPGVSGHAIAGVDELLR